MLRNEVVHVSTQDGVCPVHIVEPDADSVRPAVLLFMDAFGIRPAMYEIAERLAGHEYCVVMPDFYYRSGFTAGDAKDLFSNPERRAEWQSRVLPTVSSQNIMSDLVSIFDVLDARPFTNAQRMGVTGYCMGGRLSLVTAGTFPERIAACASYHAGGVATDAPDSPHLLAPAMNARVFVAGAIEDANFDDAQKQRLDDALTEAGVDHVVTTFNARHGWVPSDRDVHDPIETEHHWDTLLHLLDTTLK